MLSDGSAARIAATAVFAGAAPAVAFASEPAAVGVSGTVPL